MVQPTDSRVVQEITDYYGRHYRVGMSDRELLGRSRRSMLWLGGALMLAAGLPQYCYGVLVASLARAHGWSLGGALSVLITFVVVQAAVAYPVASLRARRRLSPRPAVIGGGALCATGTVVVAHSGSVAWAVAGYGVCCGLGVGLIYVSCLTVVSRWYPERSSGRVGLLTGAFACGALPFALAMAAAGSDGAVVYLDIVGAAVLVTAVVCGALLREPPRDWWPSHIDPRLWAMDKRVNPSLLRNRQALCTFGTGEALRSRAFRMVYALLVVASAVSLFDLACLAVVAAGSEFSARVVAVSFAVLIGAHGPARAVAARLSDRLGRRQVLAGVLCIGCVAQWVLLAGVAHGSAVLLVEGAGCAALGAGCGIPLCAALVRDYFGVAAAPQNFGIVYSAKAIGAICGIGLAAGAGAAPASFSAVACLALAGALMVAGLRQPGRPAVRLP